MTSRAVAVSNTNAWVHARLSAESQLTDLVREVRDLLEQDALREPISWIPEAPDCALELAADDGDPDPAS